MNFGLESLAERRKNIRASFYTKADELAITISEVLQIGEMLWYPTGWWIVCSHCTDWCLLTSIPFGLEPLELRDVVL